MGAALKLDPTRIKVTEFWKVQGDPLAPRHPQEIQALQTITREDIWWSIVMNY